MKLFLSVLTTIICSNVWCSVHTIGPLRFFSSIESWNGKEIEVTAFIKKQNNSYYIYALKDYADIDEISERVKVMFPSDKQDDWVKGCKNQYAIITGIVRVEYISNPSILLTREVGCPDFMTR